MLGGHGRPTVPAGSRHEHSEAPQAGTSIWKPPKTLPRAAPGASGGRRQNYRTQLVWGEKVIDFRVPVAPWGSHRGSRWGSCWGSHWGSH